MDFEFVRRNIHRRIIGENVDNVMCSSKRLSFFMLDKTPSVLDGIMLLPTRNFPDISLKHFRGSLALKVLKSPSTYNRKTGRDAVRANHSSSS